MGCFSSNGGDDFKAVLEAVIGVKEEGIEVPAPENHRWPKADVYLGDGWSVAYRVLDAQYWGVPQRRMRIYLVADFAGESAGEVLFKSEGLSGYTPQGFRSWQGAAGCSEESAGETGGRSDAGDRTYCLNTQGNIGVGITEDKSLALVSQDHGNHPAVLHAAGFSTEHSAKARSIGYEEEISPTLRAGVVPAAMECFSNHGHDCRYKGPIDVTEPVTATYGMGGNNQPLVVENHPTDGRIRIRKDEKCQTLTSRAGTGGNNVPLVAEPVTLKIRSGCEGGGKGPQVTYDKSSTLATNNDQTLFQPEIKAFGVCSKHSNAMMSNNPNSGFYEAKTSRTLDQSGGNSVTSNQGGICVVAPAPETYDVRFTSDGTKNARGHCYPTEISRCLDTSEGSPDSNHGGVAVVALEPGTASRVGGHIYSDGKSGTLRANAGDNQQAVMMPETYSLQGSMIGRSDKNGPQGDGINEDVCFTLNTTDRHAITAPEADHYSTSKNSHHTVAAHEQANTLVASDWKDPPLVNDTPNQEPAYIVRRLTPMECARLQGFPDWWCSDLAIPAPSDKEIAFWIDVWETWRSVTNPSGKPKSEKQIRKWLADPYTDSAEYKMWGNGCALPNVLFVLAGIAYYADLGANCERTDTKADD